jgi:hypothetical protein
MGRQEIEEEKKDKVKNLRTVKKTKLKENKVEVSIPKLITYKSPSINIISPPKSKLIHF